MKSPSNRQGPRQRILIYTIEQVEILKGPASVLYGQGSPGGIVNIVSKTPREARHHEIAAEFGSYDRMQVALDSTGKIADNSEWLYRLVGLYRDSGTQVDFVDDDRIVVAPSLTWRPGADTNITVLLNYNRTESDTIPKAVRLHYWQTRQPSIHGHEPRFRPVRLVTKS